MTSIGNLLGQGNSEPRGIAFMTARVMHIPNGTLSVLEGLVSLQKCMTNTSSILICMMHCMKNGLELKTSYVSPM